MSALTELTCCGEGAVDSSLQQTDPNYVEDMLWKTPLGTITYLRTLLELQAVSQTVEIYVTSLPPQKTSFVLAALKKVLPEHSNTTPGYQHLRRLIQPNLLPPPFRSRIKEEIQDGILWMFICPKSYAEESVISAAIESALKPAPPIYTVTAPRYPPLTLNQAKRWSELYWPTTYKRENVFGPHPPTVEKQALAVLPWIDRNMALARKAAMDGSAANLGLCSGAVICDKAGRVRAVAADARNRKGPLAHATMRAIRLIAEKRRIEGNPDIPREEAGLTEVETEYEGMVGDEKAGYLCQDLIVCLTHEPCVMCTMAIVHSRVLGVIYERDCKSGALRGDREEGYGMFWREELNWRFVAFQWKPTERNVEWLEAVEAVEDDKSF